MRHVHLIPQRDAELIRDWAPHEIPAHKPRDGRVERSERLPAPAGRPACRCCGFAIEAGEPAISADYRWKGGGAQPIWLHVRACAWGSAHEAPVNTARATPQDAACHDFIADLSSPSRETSAQLQQPYRIAAARATAESGRKPVI